MGSLRRQYEADKIRVQAQIDANMALKRRYDDIVDELSRRGPDADN